METMTHFDTDVLVVGGGPVGLALANELGMQAVPTLVIEQRDRVGYTPRAKLTNVRTAELLRRWGLADALRQASTMPADQPSNIVFTTRMTGHVLARFENAFYRTTERTDLYSEPAQWVPQYTLEEVLRQGAVDRPSVELRFNTELVSLREIEGGVIATLRRTGEEGRFEVRARYVVGTDGGRSTVRSQLGIAMQGEGALDTNLNILFRAPEVVAFYERMPAIQYWTVNSEACALMGPVDDKGLWYLIAARLGSEADPDNADPKKFISAAFGAELDIEIVNTDPWKAHSLLADRYGRGRVFLAGDACHMHPPFGGHGMNMGIGDALDIGWKLAAVLKGWGGDSLLASYELERRPVHRQVMDESGANYRLAGTGLLRDHLEADDALGEQTREALGRQIVSDKKREFFNLGLVLGYRYENSPIVDDDRSKSADMGMSIDYRPSARPGSLAPHFWMQDDRSLFDTLGHGFTFLADIDVPESEIEKVRREAASRRVPLTIVRIDDPRFFAMYEAHMAVVRPDQHIAWRGSELPDLAQLFAKVVGFANVGRAVMQQAPE